MRILLAAIATALSMPAFAADIEVHEPYVRASGVMARSAAAFMVLYNNTDKAVRLIGAETNVSRKTELHTHIIVDDVAKMREIEGGITIPAGERHIFKRGGDHVMLMGLTEKIEDGNVVEVILKFEEAEPLTVEMPVDNARKPKDHSSMDHSKMDHSGMNKTADHN